MSQGSSYVLTIHRPNQPPAQQHIFSPVAMVGRDAGDVALFDPASAPQHAQVFFNDGIVTVRDLGSPNGTFFDGARRDQFVLQPGQSFSIGNTWVTLTSIQGAAEAMPMPGGQHAAFPQSARDGFGAGTVPGASAMAHGVGPRRAGSKGGIGVGVILALVFGGLFTLAGLGAGFVFYRQHQEAEARSAAAAELATALAERRREEERRGTAGRTLGDAPAATAVPKPVGESSALAPLAPAPGPATWSAEVRSAHDRIVAMPGDDGRAITSAMRDLAFFGKAAEGALDAIARRSELAQPKRVAAGAMFADYAAFDPARLEQLFQHPNPFVVLQAIRHMAELGGSERRVIIEARIATEERLQKNARRSLAVMPVTSRLSPRMMALLDKLLNGPDDARAGMVARLVVDGEGNPEVSWGLQKLVSLPVADKPTGMRVSHGLARIHAGDAEALKVLTALGTNKFVRHSAIQELHKLGSSGDLVLRKLLENPDEPLRPQIEKLLAGG